MTKPKTNTINFTMLDAFVRQVGEFEGCELVLRTGGLLVRIKRLVEGRVVAYHTLISWTDIANHQIPSRLVWVRAREGDEGAKRIAAEYAAAETSGNTT